MTTTTKKASFYFMAIAIVIGLSTVTMSIMAMGQEQQLSEEQLKDITKTGLPQLLSFNVNSTSNVKQTVGEVLQVFGYEISFFEVLPNGTIMVNAAQEKGVGEFAGTVGGGGGE